LFDVLHEVILLIPETQLAVLCCLVSISPLLQQHKQPCKPSEKGLPPRGNSSLPRPPHQARGLLPVVAGTI